jgi:2-polyprenyl-6-methoxyphenol hydroxylase-like FAD-dependent oxidoreductase
MKVVVAGGGIGGCALALSLHAAGISDVQVYEAVSEVRELGVGVNVLPHASRELIELGLGDALAATAIPTAALVFFNRHGQRVFGEERGVAAGYNWPQYSIHRGELLGILYRAVCERLGPDRYHTGHAVVQAGNGPAGAWVDLERRSTGESLGRAEGDLVVACDGVHSVVRSHLYPDEGPPLWNGITMWRAVTEHEPFFDGCTMMLIGHMERRMVIYPISKRHADRGSSLVNWVAELKTAEGQPMPKQDWEFTADPELAATAFADFRFDWIEVPALIRGAREVFQYPMVDRDPLPQWTFGRITLLGDAAHPMYPVGSNGASQAIVDARVLAHHVATAPDISTGLTRYEDIRRPLTSQIVLANRNVGPERMMELAEQRAPDGFRDIHDVVSEAEMVEISSSYKRMAGFDAAALNERPSWSVVS